MLNGAVSSQSRHPLAAVRRVLFWLATACLVPGLLGTAALLWYHHKESRDQLNRQTAVTTRTLLQLVEQQLSAVQSGAAILANSQALTNADLAGFHLMAREALKQAKLGANLVLLDRAGRQVLNTAVDWGEPLNVPPDPASYEAIFEAGAPSLISDLFIGPIAQQPRISVAVPVQREGEVLYALSIFIAPEQFISLLQTQGLPSDWIAGIFDRKGVSVARSQQPELHIGRLASSSFLLQLDSQMEGVGSAISREGYEVVAFHSRSPTTGWAVGIGIPHTVLNQPVLEKSVILALVMALLFAAGIALAALLSERISKNFRALAQLAVDLGAGRSLKRPPLSIREASEAADMMARAAALLAERDATLQENEARFKAMADHMVQLAWMTDAQGQILWFNRRWFDYTGAEPGDFADTQWLRHLHPEQAEASKSEFLLHVQAGKPWETTLAIRSRGGAYRWFLTSALPLLDRQGCIKHWFGTQTDVTAQREMQETLEEAHLRKDEFIAILAHELRNPLAPVRTAVEILKRASPAEPALARAHAVIERQVVHMARLIDDLLDIARIGTGKLVLVKAPCDLAAIARHTAEDYQLSMESAGLTFALQVHARPVMVCGDAVRLAQILGNLLNNSVRFTERGGHIEVHVQEDSAQDRAIVKVIDTGQGISADLMLRLFDPFSQAAQDLARSKGGLGLGLALSKSLAELHGGRLSVESPGVGLGATFTLHLPLDTTIPEAASTPVKSRGHRSRRVLVIEDNEDAARTLGEFLELSDFEVEIALDGQSGVAAAQRFRPEVVISDIGLPGKVDGFEVARLLRSAQHLPPMVLIALSGYTDEPSRQRALSSGFDAYVFKPVDVNDLVALVDELAEESPRI